MKARKEECEALPQELATKSSIPFHLQECTPSNVEGSDSSCEEPNTKTYPQSTSKAGMKSHVQEEPAMAKKLSSLQGEKKILQEKLDILVKLWEIEKERLEKDLADTVRAHKLSTAQGAYRLAKLEVSFGLLKQQESLTKQQSVNHAEDALDMMKNLQATVKSLQGQLRHAATENKRLTAELCTSSSELEKRAVENETLHRALESANKELELKNMIVDSESVEAQLCTTERVLEKLTKETNALVTQHELQTKELQELKNKMADNERLATESSMLNRLTAENEALHRTLDSANTELLQRLADGEGLAAELGTSKHGLEKVTNEKEELQLQLEEASKELQDCKKKLGESETRGAELSKSAQLIEGLSLEKNTLMGQLELTRRELEKEKEAAQKAHIDARKVLEAECERAKAIKLVEEKEEELEYFTQQLECLREKNDVLRIQLNMEQLCKEAEMVKTPTVHPESRDILNRNLKDAMEQAAISTVKRAQNSPHGSTLRKALQPRRRARQGTPAAKATPVSPDDSSAQETGSRARTGTQSVEATQVTSGDRSSEDALQTRPRRSKERQTRAVSRAAIDEKVPDREADAAVQQPTEVQKKQSLGSRSRSNKQQQMDSTNVTPGAMEQGNQSMEARSDEDEGVNDENIYLKENRTRQKRPSPQLPSETEASKTKRQKKPSNGGKKGLNDTIAALAPAQLLMASGNRAQKTDTLTATGSRPRLSATSKLSSTPGCSLRLPR